MDLVSQVQESLAAHRLLDKGTRVLVGVSGGVDSVVLLHVLHQIGGYTITVGHFNHCLRGAESDADETFVKSMAKKLGLEFVSARGDVKAFADQHGVSIEMAARELRHGFLADSAERLGIEKIALAHHADDQIETFWLRLLRGDVGPGLTGMRWERSARPGTNITIIRPSLEIPKSALIQFAREQQITHRDDSSNSSPEFLRNRLRLELIARLKTFQPALRDVTLRTAGVLAAEKDFLEQTAREWLQQTQPPKGAFANLHLALQREALRLQLLQLGVKPNFELIEELRTLPEHPVAVSPERALKRLENGELVAVQNNPLPFSDSSQKLDLSSPGCARFRDLEFRWEIVKERAAAAAGVEFFDSDAVGPSVTLRHWQRGDRFQPIGQARDSKLQDLFTNLKLTPADKRNRVLATDYRGKIFWVEGLRISEQHKLSTKTRRVLRWSWRVFQPS